MGHLALWKVLERIIADLRQKGIIAPPPIMGDLKSARTMIRVLESSGCEEGVAEKLEGYLANIESYIVSEGQKVFGDRVINEWFKQLSEARAKTPEKELEASELFIPKLSREKGWLRVKTSNELPLEKLKILLAESKLDFSLQKDGYLVVYGTNEDIKNLVKKMALAQKSNCS